MSLKKNIIFNFILTASTILFPLITFPYITKTISTVDNGRVFFIDAFTQYFILFSAIGIPFYGVREIAKLKNESSKRSKLVIELVLLQFILSLIFSLLFIVAQAFVPNLHQNLNLIKISCLVIIANSFLIEWFYQGIENFSYITVRSLFIKTISVVAIFIFVKSSSDYVVYYLILALLVLGNAILNFLNFIRKFYVSFTDKISLISHIKPLSVLFSINVSVSVYTILDTIILGMLTDTQNVSLYNVPLKLVKMFWLVVSGVGTVLIPRMAVLFIEKDNNGITNLMEKSLNIIFLLTIPFSFFCLQFPAEILTVVSGQKYVGASNALRILSVVPFIIGLCNVWGTQFLLPIGQEKKILHATIVGLIISLLLNFILIPQLKFLGSSIACLGAETSVCIYVFLSAKKHIKMTVDYRLLCHIFICILTCLAFSFILKQYFHNLLLVLIEFVVYLFCFSLLQFFAFKNPFIYSLIKFKVNSK